MEVLCFLVNLVIETMYWPDDWMQSNIVPLFKAGGEGLAGSYRGRGGGGIALESCVAKVMTRVWLVG